MLTPETEPMEQEQAETVELPLSACPDCKPGDTLMAKVISVDAKSGTINVTIEESGETEGGSDSMASELGEVEDQQPA